MKKTKNKLKATAQTQDATTRTIPAAPSLGAALEESEMPAAVSVRIGGKDLLVPLQEAWDAAHEIIYACMFFRNISVARSRHAKPSLTLKTDRKKEARR